MQRSFDYTKIDTGNKSINRARRTQFQIRNETAPSLYTFVHRAPIVYK